VTRHLGNTGNEVLGIDLHQPCIDYAQNNFGHNTLEFRCLSAESLQETSTHWDVIVLADVLEHLNDPMAVLRTCRRLLADGGRLLVSVPNGYGPFEIESALARVPLLGTGLLKLTSMTISVMDKFVFKGLWSRAMEVLPADIPYNHDSLHVQFRSERSWISLFETNGFQVHSKQNLAFVSGPFSNTILRASSNFVAVNVWAAYRMPSAFTSNWAFELSACPSIRAAESAAGEQPSEGIVVTKPLCQESSTMVPTCEQ
jgi:SAM-dependent methyltransferase